MESEPLPKLPSTENSSVAVFWLILQQFWNMCADTLIHDWNLSQQIVHSACFNQPYLQVGIYQISYLLKLCTLYFAVLSNLIFPGSSKTSKTWTATVRLTDTVSAIIWLMWQRWLKASPFPLTSQYSEKINVRHPVEHPAPQCPWGDVNETR